MRFKDYDIDEYIERLENKKQELEKLKEENPEAAKREALEGLQRSGILDENGNLKPPYNGEKVNPTDFTRGPKPKCSNESVSSLIGETSIKKAKYYIQVAQSLTPTERAKIWHLVSRSCETCTNQCCNIETYEKVGLDEFGEPQGSSCIGWKNDRIIGEYKALKLTK